MRGREEIRKEKIQREIIQEIIVNSNGCIEVPWIKPAASPLVKAIWEELVDKDSIPVTVLTGTYIYCG